MKKLISSLLMVISITSHASPNKILIVLSSEKKITLQNGVQHPTGYFLSELMVPAKALKEAGYELVFATPKGNQPTMDKISDSAAWFGDNTQKYQEIKRLLISLDGLRNPYTLSDIRKQNLDDYAGIFIPGGHAPMEDLLIDEDLGTLLNYFHSTQKITGLICHGPIALLSALQDPTSFVNEIAQGKQAKGTNWIYQGYNMTSFSNNEEKQEEPGEDNALGGFIKFYPNQALRQAGGNITVKEKWHSHVVRDRELITAQNPMSDVEFTKTFLQALNELK